MLAEAELVTELPRLLDLDSPPPPARLRWYWRYIQRWRTRLFHLWREQTRGQADGAAIARAVDDLLAVFFLMEYLRRRGQHGVPVIQNVCQSAPHPSVFSIAECVSQTFSAPILAAALDPEGFDSGVPIPDILFHDHWERRIADATWLLYGDKGLPLSLFGDFHQLCVGNPLTAQTTGMKGQPARRVRGMFYTPAPIVDYLVSTTLDQVLADRHPDELFTVRLLDPSCGCGAFLIGCVRYLFRWLERSLNCGVEEATRMALAIAERMLHGCDIDSQAIRWSVRLLLLAAWEHVTPRLDSPTSACPLSIPNFGNVIQCKSFLDPRSDDGDICFPTRFDAIIGGPPFVRFEQLHQTQREQLPGYRRNYLTARRGQFDLYMLFIERAIDLLKDDGCVAFSLSNSFLKTTSGQTVRGYIAANACVEEVVEFNDPRTYADATTQIALLRLRKTRRRFGGRHVLARGQGHLRRKLDGLVSGRLNPDISITPLQPEATASSRWRLTTSEDSSWLEGAVRAGIPLDRLATMEYGPSTALDPVLLLKQISRFTNGKLLVQARNSTQPIQLEKAAMQYVVRGRHIRGYRPPILRYLHPFPYDACGQMLSERSLQDRCPLMYSYLLLHRAELAQRSLSRGCRWYSTFCHHQQVGARSPRLFSARIVSTGSFTLIDDPAVLAHNSVIALTPRLGAVDIYYLLGILNSRIFGRYVSLVMPPINAGRHSIRLSALRRFPVPNPQLERNREACMHIASLVRDLTRVPMGRPLPPDITMSIENEVARLYGSSRLMSP